MRRKKRSASRTCRSPKPSMRQKVVFSVLTAMLAAGLVGGAYGLFAERGERPSQVAACPAGRGELVTFDRKARSLDELLTMSPEQLGDVDIAEMNLLCATGLPGAEGLDVDGALAVLDRWAAWVKFETDRHLYKFRQDPSNYQDSEGYFRMLMLITVLQQDLGVHYNMERVRQIDFRRSQDLFIHGLTGNDNGGTCVSMPVVYTAVARRLGYPVKLVLTKAHVFCRWDAPTDRFNIEATNAGMNSFPDEYYLAWPEKVSEAEARKNRYLVSLTPAEELASFLASRGHCLIDLGRTKEAFEAYAAANRFAPDHPAYLAWAVDAESRLQPATFAHVQQGFHDPAMVYRDDPMAEVERINAMSQANARRTYSPPRGVPQAPLPPRQNLGLSQPYQPPVPGEPPRP